MVKNHYTRDELIAICEQAISPQSTWHDRDSEGATRQLGECWALLKAGCDYRMSKEEPCVTDKYIIWIEIVSKGFDYFEIGELREDTFYLPTPTRLAARAGKDWY